MEGCKIFQLNSEHSLENEQMKTDQLQSSACQQTSTSYEYSPLTVSNLLQGFKHDGFATVVMQPESQFGYVTGGNVGETYTSQLSEDGVYGVCLVTDPCGSVDHGDQVGSVIDSSVNGISQTVCADQLFYCFHCSRKFKTEGALRRHIPSHSDRTNEGLVRTGEGYVHRSGVTTNISVTPSEKQSHVCDVCHKTFKQFFLLQPHEMVHSDERPFSCIQCPKTFKVLSHLRDHEKVHTGIRPYKCATCDKAFIHAAELHQHDSVHSDERPYTCDVCNKTFKQFAHIVAHRITHSEERPHECNVCGRTYKSATHLQIHLQVHDSSRSFQCAQCAKWFRRAGDLRSHERIHGDERPYSCPACKKAFKKLSYPRSHEIVHFEG